MSRSRRPTSRSTAAAATGRGRGVVQARGARTRRWSRTAATARSGGDVYIEAEATWRRCSPYRDHPHGVRVGKSNRACRLRTPVWVVRGTRSSDATLRRPRGDVAASNRRRRRDTLGTCAIEPERHSAAPPARPREVDLDEVDEHDIVR